jgi:hypothetical protein
MDDRNGDTRPDDPALSRLGELDALAGLLPYHRRDGLSVMLFDADIATSRHRVESGMRANTLRAIVSDRLGRTQTTDADQDANVFIIGAPVVAPEAAAPSFAGSISGRPSLPKASPANAST